MTETVKIEKQVWESTLNRSMVLEAENEQLKSKLQLKETAYDFDTARLEEENKKLKELLKECRENIEVTGYNEFGKAILLNKINEVLGEE